VGACNLALAAWVVAAWWDDVWRPAPDDATQLLKAVVLLVLLPLPTVLVLSFRTFTKRA
jgi:hypothetical protein